MEEVKERYPAAGVAVPNFEKAEEEKSGDERQEEEPQKVDAAPSKPPIDARFQVKRAVRPTMPLDMLADLEKMKKRMSETNTQKPPLAAASFKPAPRFL